LVHRNVTNATQYVLAYNVSAFYVTQVSSDGNEFDLSVTVSTENNSSVTIESTVTLMNVDTP